MVSGTILTTSRGAGPSRLGLGMIQRAWASTASRRRATAAEAKEGVDLVAPYVLFRNPCIKRS